MKNGNIFQHLLENIYAFPTKHNWYESSNINLIIQSAESLAALAKEHPENYYLLPRPDCSNGQLEWSFVKPHIENILPDNVIAITDKKNNNIEEL